MNDFASSQHYTWRMVFVLKNSNNNAETGWTLYSPQDQNAHPFKTWHLDGELYSIQYCGISLTKNQFHEFKVHDQNGDKDWSFAYDGNSLGNVYVNMSSGSPISESERKCTTDSLWAHVKNLSKINTVNGSWTSYTSLSQYVDTPAENDYDFCKNSNTEFHVLQTC